MKLGKLSTVVSVFAVICSAISLIINLYVIPKIERERDFPPRDQFPRVYETKHVRAIVCFKCHERP